MRLMHVFAAKHGIGFGVQEARQRESVRELFEHAKRVGVKTMGVEMLLHPSGQHDLRNPITRYWLEFHRQAEENGIPLVELKTPGMIALTFVEDILEQAHEHGVRNRTQWNSFRKQLLDKAVPQNDEGARALKSIHAVLDEIERINPEMKPEFTEKLCMALAVRQTYSLHAEGERENADGITVGTGHALHLKTLEGIEPTFFPSKLPQEELRQLARRVSRDVEAHKQFSGVTKSLLEIAEKR